jgi:hypothetical protein
MTMNQDQSVTATFAKVPVIGGPPGVHPGDLFCGVQHRGVCAGLKIKTEFGGPGNAAWQFAAYNPPPGRTVAQSDGFSAIDNIVASKVVVLGVIKRKVTKAGRVTIVFKLPPGARTKRLYKEVLKLRLKTIRVKLTFTTSSGQRRIVTKNIALKR